MYFIPDFFSFLGDIRIVELLILYGSPLDLVDANGNSSIMLAAAKGQLEMILLLAAKGASLQVPTVAIAESEFLQTK